MDICPKGGNKSSPISQREGLRCKLADQHIKGNNSIVVDLQSKKEMGWGVGGGVLIERNGSLGSKQEMESEIRLSLEGEATEARLGNYQL